MAPHTLLEPAWSAMSSVSLPQPDEVHVWRIELDLDPVALTRLAACLDPHERARADHFHFAHDRRRYVTSHTASRHILAAYLGVAPADVAFARPTRAKPYLAPPFAASGLRYNLSHSGELALLAVASGRPVGVDVERVAPLPDPLSVAETFFDPAETAQLRPLLGGPLGLRAFYTCWTRKEAFIKATGEGMGRSLDSFVVTFLPHETPALLRADASRAPVDGWSLVNLDPHPDYVGALVVAGPPPTVMMNPIMTP